MQFKSTEEISFISHSNISAQYLLNMYNYILTGTHRYIHSQVFMLHGYTDDIPHGYRKSFSLMGKVKSCLLKGLV